MSDGSHIEWTEATWNPIAGCSVVSPGCTNCYAMRRVAPRLAANPLTPHYAGTVMSSKGGPVWTGKIGIAADSVLTAPLRWKRPRMIFVNSTSDLFHPGVPNEIVDRIFAVMALCPQHTFQVLTKRPERMRSYMTEFVKGAWAGRMTRVDNDGAVHPEWDAALRVHSAMCDLLPKVPASALNNATAFLDQKYGEDGYDGFMPGWPLPNVWLGTSVEDQRRADERIPELLATPAAVRFISAEPLLGPIDLAAIDVTGSEEVLPLGAGWLDRLEDGEKEGSRLDWVIVGGESGPGARPMHPDWARSLRDQCARAGVPFFFKQWGEFVPQYDVDIDPQYWSAMQAEFADYPVHEGWCFGRHADQRPWMMFKRGKKIAGRLLDGIEHNGMPTRPADLTGVHSEWAKQSANRARAAKPSRVGQ